MDLSRLSHTDPEIRQVVTRQNVRARSALRSNLLPFARAAGVADPCDLAGTLADLTVVYTVGALVSAGPDPDALRRHMDRVLSVVHDAIVLGGRSAAAAPGSGARNPQA